MSERSFLCRLLMSEDVSPTSIVLLESIHRIIQVFFLIFAMSQESIMVRFPMFVSDHIKFLKSSCSENPNFLVLFIFPPLVVCSHCSLPLSVVSVRRSCLCCHLHCYPRAAAIVIRSCRPQPPPSAVVVSRCCLCHHQRSPQCPTAVFHSPRCVSASSAAFISPKIGKSNF